MIKCYKQIIEKDYSIYIIDSHVKHGLDISCIDQKDLSEIYKYKRDHDRYKRMLSRCFLFQILKENGYKNKTLDFIYNDFKRPSILASKFKFSFSYSDQYILLAVSKSVKDLGADIENIQNDSIDINVLYKEIMSIEEIKYFEILIDNIEKQRFFYDVWTIKESYVKALEKGLFIEVKSLNIFELQEKEYIKKYDLDTDYKIAITIIYA
ncbi:4'-phosphopantetheinyl transferase family protein [Francisella frigiditurris]|uniref:4'-phosphopantetheinyl transferase superfamily protein n=1 Tax=Francisella frigiditurris TaxID=1542390 RepID=A0A1J0KRK4_9GAMM|nr:4'-phosphopantetheinyl transferase superfamily protein [Francisella frigiditurris]APC96330.1 4'-phosphopantetheinyl transferase superfamily protein [Francisella frigiditurris]